MTQFLDTEPVLVSEPAPAPVPERAMPASAMAVSEDSGGLPDAEVASEPAAEPGMAASMAGGMPGNGPQSGIESGAAGTPSGEPGSGPAALADLVAAGLVSHEMIGDPLKLGPEAAMLRRLCAHVSGSIWRIEPYHYAFRLENEAAPETAPETAGAALEARLAAEFGPDAVWVSTADLIAEAEIEEGEGDLPEAAGETVGDMAIDLDAPLLLLRAGAEAVADGLDFAGPGVQAVVSASFAAQAARIAADRIEAHRMEAARIEAARTEADRTGRGRNEDPEVALRLAALETGQARIEAALAAEAESRAAAAAAEVRLTELLAKVLRRLDAQADVLHAHIAREDQVAARLGEIAQLAEGRDSRGGAAEDVAANAVFRETIGLALAEFLARLDRREAAMRPSHLPQVSREG